jgi:hypothetical protein
VVPSLPHGYGHSTRDIVFTADDARMLVSVGSDSNDAEGMGDPPGGREKWIASHPLGAIWGQETDRAAVLAFDPEGKNKQLFATGIRNCVGLAIQPATGVACARPTNATGSATTSCPITSRACARAPPMAGPGITLVAMRIRIMSGNGPI